LCGSTRINREAAGGACWPPPANTLGSAASAGRGGAWLRLLMTSSFASWMSVPTSKVSVTKPAPRLIKALISVTPGVFRRTLSCGSDLRLLYVRQ
jgi:hypothetical protein